MQSQLPSFEDVVYHSLYNISLVYPTCWKCVPDGSEVTGHVGIFGHSSYTKSKRGSVERKAAPGFNVRVCIWKGT